MILDLLSIALIALGLVFFLGGAVGLIRFPDFYTRMHAAGKGDTLSTFLIVGGLVLYQGHDVISAWGSAEWYKPWFVILKLLAVSFFIMFTSPTSTHVLIDAGYRDKIKPVVSRDDLTRHSLHP